MNDHGVLYMRSITKLVEERPKNFGKESSLFLAECQDALSTIVSSILRTATLDHATVR